MPKPVFPSFCSVARGKTAATPPVTPIRIAVRRLLQPATVALTLLAMADRATAEVADSWGSWAQVVGEGNLGFVDPGLQDMRLWLEGQMRWNEDWQHWYQGMARVALGYSLSDRATVWLGYTYLPTQVQGRPYVAQQDLWPAFRYILPTEFGTLMFRTMFEANFLRGDDPRYRPRQMIRLLHPFEFEPRLSLVVWDEFFVRVNTTHWGGQAGFDQNRVFLGFGWSFTPGIRTELGYMNQYIEDAKHVNQIDNNLVMGSLFVSW